MKKYFQIIICLLSFMLLPGVVDAQSKSFISDKITDNGFTLSENGKSASIVINSQEYPGVIRVAKDLQRDIKNVTSAEPSLFFNDIPNEKEIVIIGTIGKSKLIDELISQNKLDVNDIKGKWETYKLQVIEKPFPEIDRALIIVGSDKRGTIFGMYDLSEKIGVSPWYWWADVAIEHKDKLYVNPDTYIQGPPSVKYRGIFLNDEYPNLTKWIIDKFGFVTPNKNPPRHEGIANYNHEFYTKLFELILRLKGNYLWPAMWNNAFNEDDPENPKLADEYGIVMGNSHQEPMLRAQKEWDRRYSKTLGSWNYAKYPDTLNNFWREGIRRNKDYESIITIGLRGADDTPMAPGGPEANMALLEKIVDVQRKIISEEMNSDVTKVPQLWCLYKEVLEFYNAGMRVPDDVTLLWAEDNWGNVRRLPTNEERQRSGGAGIYYHFDYHGGPRSYQWINTNPIPKIWDQLSLAKQYGADRIWIVNVGHFKGYEFPLEYFMDLAWNTKEMTNDNFDEYTQSWATREFGSFYSKEIADIVSMYTKFNGRRKPELLSPFTYSLVNYNEAETVVDDYNKITCKAEEIYNKLPAEKRDAFYELVLFPVKACAIVNQLYLAAGKNALYAKQNRASTNDMAAETRALFSADTSLMGYFNRSFLNGKWNHFMDQTHLGYTSWNDPPQNSLRAVTLKEIEIPDEAEMGVCIEGSEVDITEEQNQATLLPFDVFNQQKRYIEIFNKGKLPFEFNVSTKASWIILSQVKGKVEKDNRIWVSIDWENLPTGKNSGALIINGTNENVTLIVDAFKPDEPARKSLGGFVEGEGFVSIEAEHFSNKSDYDSCSWIKIHDYGHTLSAMRANAPANVPAAIPGKNSPCLEYKMYLFNSGNIEVEGIFSPTLNFLAGRPLQYAISFDDDKPQIVTLVPADFIAQHGNMDWEKVVADNARISKTKHKISNTGYHTLKIWMIDPGVVLQKIILNTGGVKPSYLGPTESFNRILNEN